MGTPIVRGSILMFLLGLITVMVVIAFAFVRVMQIESGSLQVQRRDDLAVMAAQMGLHHAIAVISHEYAATSEKRDNQVLPPVTRLDGPWENTFQLLSPRQNSGSTHRARPYDLAPDVPFQDLFGAWCPNYHQSTTRIIGWTGGWTQQRGYARFHEANRFDFDRSRIYDPSTFDLYDPEAATPNPAVVQTPFPPVDPFLRGAAFTRRHALDNPLWLDNQYRPVTDARHARYRLRYAIATYDMSSALWLNTDMPWLNAAGKAAVRAGYSEAIEAVGAALGKAITLSSVFHGYGAYGNSDFNRAGENPGVPLDWPGRGGKAMLVRHPSQGVFSNVHGSTRMDWNDPAGTWLGQGLTSFNDLGFAVERWDTQWYRHGETKDNEPRVRGDGFAQRAGTPFGRPYDGATDHPWAINALTASARVLQAMIRAYVPPAVRAVRVDTERMYPYAAGVDGNGNPWGGFQATSGSSGAYNWSVQQWSIPASLGLTTPGGGYDILTDSYRPAGSVVFDHPTPAFRDYWRTAASDRPNHDDLTDTRANAQRYPGALFFQDAAKEPHGQRLTRWARASGTAAVGDPRITETDNGEDVDDDGVLDTEDANSNGTLDAGEDLNGNGVLDKEDSNGDGVLQRGDTDYTPPQDGWDHLGRHIVFYWPDGSAAASKAKPWTTDNYLTYNASLGTMNVKQEFLPSVPFGKSESGAGKDGAISVFSGTEVTVYRPANPVPVADDSPYPAQLANTTEHSTALATSPPLRHQLPYTGFKDLPGPPPVKHPHPDSWEIKRSAGSWNREPQAACKNSYWHRVTLAFAHAVLLAQRANLAWADPQDTRSAAVTLAALGDSAGILYQSNYNDGSTRVRKGHTAGKWDPAALHFQSLEQIDRQFLANLGESFDQPGRVTPTQALALVDPSTGAPRPPRYNHFQNVSNDPSPGNYGVGTTLRVVEYRVSNNIRTLLTPIDATAGGALTASSATDQTGANVPPRKRWLLDEWNLGGEAGYVPGTTIDVRPTRVARARAKLMERLLNDWRMSFLGSAKAYAAGFRAKDFDGDGRIFCSSYQGLGAADPDCGLTCWTPDGDGDGSESPRTVFSVTGCLAITRSHQYKIQVRGEVFDNNVNKPVSEHYLEAAYLVDPDDDINRAAALPTGLEDSLIIMQRPIHNYYRGYLNRSYP